MSTHLMYYWGIIFSTSNDDSTKTKLNWQKRDTCITSFHLNPQRYNFRFQNQQISYNNQKKIRPLLGPSSHQLTEHSSTDLTDIIRLYKALKSLKKCWLLNYLIMDPIDPNKVYQMYLSEQSVVNISNITLTPTQVKVLSRGLTFCPTPNIPLI